MPKNPASDVAHTVQTDHRVLRDPTQAPLQPKTGITPLQDLVIFDSGDTRLPPEEVDRGKAILATNRPGATTIEQLDLKVQQLLFSGEGVTEAGTPDFSVIGDDVPALHALAFSLLLSHRAPEAIPIWERILEISPLDERALTQLLAHKQDESLEKMAQLTERLIESNPNHGLHWGRRTYVLGQLNRIDEAIRCAEKALKLNPQLLQVREWLVENYAKMGDLEKSSQHRKKLQEILELTKDLRKMEKNLPSAGGEVSAP
jgi:tetratricopeptide (TPR) repeat protein